MVLGSTFGGRIVPSSRCLNVRKYGVVLVCFCCNPVVFSSRIASAYQGFSKFGRASLQIIFLGSI